MTFENDPEQAWRTSASGAFITMPGEVAIWALGDDRFRVTAPDGEHKVTGHDAAVALAHRLAGDGLRSAR